MLADFRTDRFLGTILAANIKLGYHTNNYGVFIKSMAGIQISPGFHSLDIDAKTYFLDTNVWISLASSFKALNKFLSWLQANNAIAALSIFTVFELSRANKYLHNFDKLLTATAPRIYIPLLYDELSDLEMFNYPNEVELLWNPLTNFQHSTEIEFLSALSEDPLFLNKRQEYFDFGHDRFMNLEAFKKNFPFEDEVGKYSTKDAELFAWATSLDFLLRYFPRFLLPFKGNLQAFDTSKLKSLHFRGLFLYYKYYVHGQSPVKSDFIDFAHVSYLPYIDVFVTERNVLNVLSHIKADGSVLPKFDLIHVPAFVRGVETFDT